MRFKGLDLNLIMALDVLLEEGSVSNSARRLNMTQPAMSAALNRLREYFNDEILISNGRRMMATAYAQSLAGRVKAILADVQLLISTSSVFDPKTSDRTFRIAASDYITAVLITPLAERLASTAPGVRLNLRFPSEHSQVQLDNGDLDLVITPEEYISADHPSELVLEEDHVLAGWSGNPYFQAAIDVETFFGLSHVAVSIGSRQEGSFAERRMEAFSRKRNIEITAPSFTTVPWLLINTNRVAIMHKRLADTVRDHMPLSVAPLPFAFPAMREMMQYHRATGLDGGLIWLRQQIAAIAHINRIDD
ncbi:nodulation protein D 1 [Asticcacaulis biprosthecium C19]|uniref:Nodulation protein D 1 n=1 Tax=Asticcacaulis biprosthecium C19 TaxID=715226 RepID=F4QT93_9CAUL|nr:LysR family transcriptional regulator [Asticcacaulis biprosthecium]EGF89963.1 nodulation protein D 1 [Asticcacaulis biprosthecium C19]